MIRARTRVLDTAPALEDIAGADGWLFARQAAGIAGRGVAARVPIDDAAAMLASIDHDDATGCSPLIALGSLPFTPGAPAELIVPQTLVRITADGRRTVTVTGGADADLGPGTSSRAGARRFTVGPLTPVERYLDAVRRARDAVRAGELLKAVIAREVEVLSDAPIDLHAVLVRLRAAFGSSYRYSIDGLVGASPELLVEVDGATVRCLPLAGTAPISGDPLSDRAAANALVASTKDQVEHRVVIDDIRDRLLPWCSFLDEEPEPSVIAVANVQHLATAMEGHLSDPRPTVVELVRALSPTPALGGFPRDLALALIADAEGFDRGRYGGAVGWVDASGNGTWAVTIRCAELSADRHSARLVAGGGIVAASDPLAELAETQAKLQAMLAAIIRP